MNIELKAKEFAIKAHKGQVRKSDKEKPMIIHPINVGQILKQYGFDENVVSAGYLHDVVEDTSYEIEDIKDNFNDDIASLVYGASEPDKSLSWEERKTHTIEETKNLPLRNKLVICADKINNLDSKNINAAGEFSFNDYPNLEQWHTLLKDIIPNLPGVKVDITDDQGDHYGFEANKTYNKVYNEKQEDN